MLTVVRTVARSAMSVEALALRRRGTEVQLVAPNAEAAAVMGTNFMDPEPSDRVAGSRLPAGPPARRRLSARAATAAAKAR